MPAVVRFQGDGFRPFSLSLQRFGANIQDADVAFNRMAGHVATVFKSQFDTQGGRMVGGRWAPLSPAYAAQKAKKYPGAPLLVATGELRNSLAFRPFGTEVITHTRMMVGTAVPYAGYHQRGTARMPQRRLLGRLNGQDMKAMSKIMHDHIMNGVTSR